METPIWLSIVLSWLGLTWSIYRLFNMAGDSIKQESKAIVSDWLKNSLNKEELKNWSLPFKELFDKLFTQKHLSWMCFFRSSIATIVSVVIVYFILNSIGINSIFRRPEYLLIPLFVNFIPDYLSLLETRYILSKLNKVNSYFAQLMLLILDFFLTFFIFYLLGFIGASLFSELVEGASAEIGVWNDRIINGIILRQKESFEPITFILFSSTFLTSVWIWVFLISSTVIKTLNSSIKFISFWGRHLEIDEKPFKAIGFILTLIITLIYVLWGVFKLLN